MAITRSSILAEVILDALCTFFHHKRNQLRRFLECRKFYKNTLRELSAFTGRNQADLEKPRNTIRRLTWEMAYGE